MDTLKLHQWSLDKQAFVSVALLSWFCEDSQSAQTSLLLHIFRLEGVLPNPPWPVDIETNLILSFLTLSYHILSFLGWRVQPDPPRPLGTEADPAVWDPACASRNDDPGTQWCRKNKMHQCADEGHDWLWCASQGDAHESKSHYSPSDVWQIGRGNKWLDGWDLLNIVETHA